MKYCKIYIVAACCVSIISCSQKVTKIYYNDSSKVDDGEIFGEALHIFFIQDKSIHIYQIQSNNLNNELQKIKDSINSTLTSGELDDSRYTYAFITVSKDTLFADYRLSYWKYKRKSILYENEKVRLIIDKAPK